MRSPAKPTERRPSPLSDLTPAELLIAELKALVGESINKTAFFEVVRAVSATAPDGSAWSTAKVNTCVEKLVRKRIVSANGEITVEWMEPLTLHVLARTDGQDVIKAVRAASPKSRLDVSGGYGVSPWERTAAYRDAHLARAVRLSALANDAPEVERLILAAETAVKAEGRDLPMASLLLEGCPASPDFIEALSPLLRDRVAAAYVERFLERGCIDPGVEALIEALYAREDGWAPAPRLNRALLRLDILAERPEPARARIERLRSYDPAMAAAADAALTFLTDPAADAAPRFREALKLHRKAAGRRKIALPQEFGIYHLLALFTAGDVSAQGEIEVQLDAMAAAGALDVRALSCLLMLVSGRDDVAKDQASRLTQPTGRHVNDGPFEIAITTWALSVIDAAGIKGRSGADEFAISQWGRHAPLAARILAEAHLRAPYSGPSWRETLKRLSPGYARNFADIVPIRPSWQRTLDRLQNFLAPPAEAKPEAAVQGRRIVFRFDAVTLEITPVEQTAKGAGWTIGRPVALKRLHQRDPKLNLLSPEDQRVIQTLRFYNTYYEMGYAFDPIQGPAALVGHPRVFDADAPERQIELIDYPVELVVREAKNTIHIDLSHRAASPRVIVEPETPTRWRLIKVTAAMVELGEILGPKGLEAPKEGREQIVALIKADNPRLPVRSELAGVAADVTPGDITPVLQIAPEGGGFLIQALVRPLGAEGAVYTPGVGSPNLLMTQGGAHRRIKRDLAGETAALEAVAAACPALAPWREDDQTWRIEDLDAALEALQQLHDLGEQIHLEWPQGAAVKPTRNIDAKSVSLNIASARDWFEVKGQIRVDEDLVLDMADVVAALSSSKGRFVPLDGGRYLALTESLRRQLDAFAAVTEASKGGRRLSAAASLVAPVADLVESAATVTAERRWTDWVKNINAALGYAPEIPAGLEAELRDYQQEGFAWMARLCRLGLGACLADDMGLGKTLQTLALLLSQAEKGPSLVVAPTSVCHNWLLEAARFTPKLKLHVLSSAADRAGLIESLGPNDVLVVSYGLLHTESDRLAGRRFTVAVFDEAQNLKNAETRRAQAGKRIDADFRLALSGTPVENRLDELWSLYDTVTPGLLGSRESFQRRFSGPIEKGRSASASQALKNLVRPYLLRRTKAAVLSELPPRTEITLEIEPGAEERAFYEALRRKALQELAQSGGEGGQKRIRILAEITRLRRAACNPALIDPTLGLESAKLAGLLELAAELKANRHRALVFSQFTGHLDLVEAALKTAGADVLRLDGSTPAKARARLVESFQAGAGDLFLISLKAGGTGLNLTAADYVIHLDPWWNPAVEDQATDRAHRIGQTQAVTVYRLVVKDSIEEQILALHASKRALTADFLDGADAAGGLGEDELMALIRGGG